MQITTGINKSDDAGRMDTQTGSAGASQRVFPKTVFSRSFFVATSARGWVQPKFSNNLFEAMRRQDSAEIVDAGHQVKLRALRGLLGRFHAEIIYWRVLAATANLAAV